MNLKNLLNLTDNLSKKPYDEELFRLTFANGLYQIHSNYPIKSGSFLGRNLSIGTQGVHVEYQKRFTYDRLIIIPNQDPSITLLRNIFKWPHSVILNNELEFSYITKKLTEEELVSIESLMNNFDYALTLDKSKVSDTCFNDCCDLAEKLLAKGDKKKYHWRDDRCDVQVSSINDSQYKIKAKINDIIYCVDLVKSKDNGSLKFSINQRVVALIKDI